MERNTKINIVYRIAEKSAKNKVKVKPEWVNNKACLNNLISIAPKGTKIVVLGDNLEDDTKTWIKELPVKFIETAAHGNSETFIEALDYALELDDSEIVYFVEDDYIHRPGAIDMIQEGLERADYVSLYDHPDKYNGQPKYLFLTDNSHWQFTHSTTMTFATKVKTLIYDEYVFRDLITTGNPPDHHIFMVLTQQLKRRLASPIPGGATHGEAALLAPNVNWKS